MRKTRKVLYGSVVNPLSVSACVKAVLDESGIDMPDNEFNRKYVPEYGSKQCKREAPIPYSYIEADDNNVYFVHDREMDEYHETGDRVCFETPINPRGKKLWAYDVQAVEEQE